MSTNRRTFFGEVLGGAAGVAVSGLAPTARVLGANDRIRFGMIGRAPAVWRFSRPPLSAPTSRPWPWPTFTRAVSTR